MKQGVLDLIKLYEFPFIVLLSTGLYSYVSNNLLIALLITIVMLLLMILITIKKWFATMSKTDNIENKFSIINHYFFYSSF